MDHHRVSRIVYWNVTFLKCSSPSAAPWGPAFLLEAGSAICPSLAGAGPFSGVFAFVEAASTALPSLALAADCTVCHLQFCMLWDELRHSWQMCNILHSLPLAHPCFLL